MFEQQEAKFSGASSPNLSCMQRVEVPSPRQLPAYQVRNGRFVNAQAVNHNNLHLQKMVDCISIHVCLQVVRYYDHQVAIEVWMIEQKFACRRANAAKKSVHSNGCLQPRMPRISRGMKLVL